MSHAKSHKTIQKLNKIRQWPSQESLMQPFTCHHMPFLFNSIFTLHSWKPLTIMQTLFLFTWEESHLCVVPHYLVKPLLESTDISNSECIGLQEIAESLSRINNTMKQMSTFYWWITYFLVSQAIWITNQVNLHHYFVRTLLHLACYQRSIGLYVVWPLFAGVAYKPHSKHRYK